MFFRNRFNAAMLSVMFLSIVIIVSMLNLAVAGAQSAAPTVTATLSPTTQATDCHSPTATITAPLRATVTVTATNTPTLGPTIVLTCTPTRVLIQVIAATAEFRAGPGTDYPVIYQAKRGNKIQISGIDSSGGWYEFPYANSTGWITNDSQVVKVIQGTTDQLPQIDAPPMPTVTFTPVPTVTPAPKPQSVLLYANGVAVARISLLEYHFSNGEKSSAPRSGYIFLVATVRIENLASIVKFSISAYDFKALDTNGALHSSSVIPEAYDCRLDSVEIIQGGKAEGCTSFEVPNTGKISIVYAPFLEDQYGSGRVATFVVRQ